MKEIGRVFAYFKNIDVAAIELSGLLVVGNKVKVKGATTDFEQIVEGIQKDHNNVQEANDGEKIAIKVDERVRPNDKVFLVEEG